MIIDEGKHVKCVFKNGTVIEGIVKAWNKDDVQLLSLNDESMMIVMHPDEDIMLIKIMPDKPDEEPETTESADPPMREEIVAKLEEAKSAPNEELQGKSLEELKQMVQAQERQILIKKIKTHYPTPYAPHKPNYGNQIDLLPNRRRGR